MSAGTDDYWPDAAYLHCWEVMVFLLDYRSGGGFKVGSVTPGHSIFLVVWRSQAATGVKLFA
jgi:hypothetical protein